MSASNMMQWQTAISEIRSSADEEDVIIRGRRLTDLVGKLSFAEMMFLLMKGEMPEKGQAKVLDALLVASMEHGISPPAMVSRCFASYGTPIQVAIGGGVLSFGEIMGGAGEQLAKKMQERVTALQKSVPNMDEKDLREVACRLIDEARGAGEKVAGFGIPLHKKDPRPPVLFQCAREEGVFGAYCHLMVLIEEELEKAVGRRIPMNLDGAGAAIILDLGFPWQASRLFIIIPRTVSMAAHYLEESAQNTRWRHLSQDLIKYSP